MRNLINYQNEYHSMPFEEYQAKFRKKIIINILKKFRPKRILEVGCGLDSILNHYKKFNLFTVIEPSESFFVKAKKDAGKNKNIKVYKGTVENNINLLNDLNFDFIIVSSLLHEIEDTREFLYSIKNISSQNTLIHFNVPNARSFHRYMALEMGLIKNIFEPSEMQKRMQQSHIFDMNILKNTLIENNFKILDSGSYFIKPFTHSQMQKIIDNNLLPINFLDGLSGMISHIPELGSEIYINAKKGD